MKAILNDKNEIIQVVEINCSNLKDIETDFDFGGNGYEFLYKDGVPIYYVDKGKIIKRTDEEIKLEPEYDVFLENQRKVEYELNTDGEILRAVRELLKDTDIRAKLSSETQQRLANTELQVEQIKSKYEVEG